MTWVDRTININVVMAPTDCQSFKDFQDLNSKVREALVIFVETSDKEAALEHLVLPSCIGQYTDMITAIRQKQLRDFMWEGSNALSMARCFRDCKEDMLLAKMTWREDY